MKFICLGSLDTQQWAKYSSDEQIALVDASRRNPFERRFRDMHTLSQQVQAHVSNFELVGQSLLGVPSTSHLL